MVAAVDPVKLPPLLSAQWPQNRMIQQPGLLPVFLFRLRDHRVQLLLRDAVRYRDAQAAAKSAQHKPVPHVQRPGPAPARNADADGRVKDLTERLNRTGTLRDAAALLAAQRAARR